MMMLAAENITPGGGGSIDWKLVVTALGVAVALATFIIACVKIVAHFGRMVQRIEDTAALQGAHSSDLSELRGITHDLALTAVQNRSDIDGLKERSREERNQHRDDIASLWKRINELSVEKGVGGVAR